MFHINKKFSCPQSFKGRFQPIKIAGCAGRICLVPWEWGQRGSRDHSRWLATELGMRVGGWSRGGGRGNLKLAYLLPWLAWLTGSQGMPSGVGGGDKGEVMGKAMGEDLCENLGVGHGGRGDHSRCLPWSWG